MAVYRDFTKAGVLIVDDTAAHALGMLCEGFGFRNVFTAKHGISALKILRQHMDKIDLIFLNSSMPDLSGLDVAEIIAKTHQKIFGMILLTPIESVSTERAFHQLSTETVLAGQVLCKPFEIQQMRDACADALRDVYIKRGTSSC